MNVKFDQRSYRQLGSGIEKDPAAADIETTNVKSHALALHSGADQARTAPFANSGEKAAAYFEKTVPVERLMQNAITPGKMAVILFPGFTDHDDRDMAQCRVGLDLQATLRSRHSDDFLSEVDE